MADLNNCIQNAVQGGEVDPARARAAQERYQALVRKHLAEGAPQHMARQLAKIETMESITQAAHRRRHVLLAQIRDLAEANRTFRGIAAANPDALPRAVELADAERQSLEQRFMSRISDFLAHNRTRVTGQLRDKAMVQDVTRELHGQATGNVNAKEFAAAIRAVSEDARQMFNTLGGDIGKLENRGVAHSHNTAAIRAAGFEAWFDTLWNGRLIAWHKIADFETGKPFTADPTGTPNRAAAERFLRNVFDGITTQGWSRREPSMVGQGARALYGQRAEHRVLHFTDGDAWLKYNDAFGSANPFDTIVGELRGMARDIAMMRNFGPNPNAGLEFRAQIMAKDVSGQVGEAPTWNLLGRAPLRDVISRKTKKAKVMMRHLSGDVNTPPDGTMAAFFAGVRNVLTAAQLGSAVISSVTDLVTVRMAARAMGLRATGPWQQGMKMMTDRATQQQAADLGYIFDTWFNTGSAQARMIGDVWSPEWTNRLTNFTLRSTGLSMWTDRWRTALRMSFSLELGEAATSGWDALEPGLRNFLANRGLLARDWEALRAPGALYRLPTGGHAISPAWFAEHSGLPRNQAEAIAARLSRAVEDFTELGVPSASIRGRATFMGEAPPGSIPGELMRSSTMYKSFGLSMFFNHFRRVADMQDLGNRAVYTAALIAQMTAMGAVALQLKELAKGRDPHPMDDPAVWGAAMLQGGGVGILGDFLSNTTSRAGGGIAETVAGPVIGLAGDLGRVMGIDSIARLVDDRPSRMGRDAVNLARRYNPLASHVALRTALDRMVWDQLQDILDPEAREDWGNARRRAMQGGTDLWWQRGRTAPDRAPDFSNMMGANP